MLGGAAPLHQKQQTVAPGAAVAYASSTAPASTDSDVGGSIFSFGSYTDEMRGVGAQGPPRPALGAGGVAGGATFVGSSFGPAGAAQQAAVPPVPAPLVEVRAVPLPATGAAPVVAVDELGNLLEKLNMAKYRPKFNSKQVIVLTFRVLEVRACMRVCVGGGTRDGVRALVVDYSPRFMPR